MATMTPAAAALPEAPAGPAPEPRARVDAQHPWPGLAPYDEASGAWFKGRDEEAAELFRLIRLAPLTVLYGASGLGKSSLLQAGLFPRLRAEHFLPVYLRLDFSERADAPPLEQAARRLEKAIAESTADGPQREPGEDLWRFTHRRDFELWTADNFPLVPVLVFDQFEELFSRGGAQPERIGPVIDALGDLIDNRIPTPLANEESRAERERLDLRVQRYKVLLSFREDFLPHIESWKDKIPSLLNNRLRLLPMTRPQAIHAIDEAGAQVMEDGVAARIVDLITRRDGNAARSETPVEPVLLSLCCTRLNARRADGSRMDAALVDSAGEEILEDFYREAIEGMPQRVPEFIETHLIQGDRYRGSYPLVEALEQRLLSAEELSRLTDHFRLLRIDQESDTARIELIHDRLVEIVRVARDTRLRDAMERKALAERARRKRVERDRERIARMRNGLLALSVVLFASVAIAVWTAQRAIRAEKQATDARLATLDARLVGEAQAILHGGLVEKPRRALLQLIAAQRMGRHNVGIESALLNELFERPQMRKLIATDGTASAMSFSANGNQIIVAGVDKGTLRTLDVNTGRTVGDMLRIGGGGWVWAIAVSRDGLRLATGDDDGNLQLWDARDGRPIALRAQAPKRHAGAVRALAFSPDGRLLVSASADKSLRLWDGMSGEPLGALLGEHNGPVASVTFSPDGKLIASAGEDRTVRLWNPVTRWQVGAELVGHGAAVRSVAFSPDGRLLASAGEDRTVRLWNPRSGRASGEPLRGHTGGIGALAFTADGRGIITGSWDGTVRRWDLATRKAAGEVLKTGSRGVTAIALSPAGNIASAIDGGDVALWKPGTQASVVLGRHTAPVMGAAFSPDSRRIASAGLDHSLRLWELAGDGTPVSFVELDAEDFVWSVAFSPDGQHVASGGNDDIVRLWDARSPGLIRNFPKLHTSMVWSVAFSPDGKLLASASEDGTVRLWDAQSGAHVGPPLRGHAGGVNGVAFSPDGKRIATVGDDRSLRVWDAETHKPLVLPPMLHDAPAVSVVFTDDGMHIVTGDDSGTLRRWDANSGRMTGNALKEQDGRITGLAFSAVGGRRIVSASADGSLRLWDMDNWLPIGNALKGHTMAEAPPSQSSLAHRARASRAVPATPMDTAPARVNAVAFSADGRRIVSASSNTELRLWPGPAAWVDEACAKLTRNMSEGQWREWVTQDLPYEAQCPGLPIPPDAPDAPAQASTSAAPRLAPGEAAQSLVR